MRGTLYVMLFFSLDRPLGGRDIIGGQMCGARGAFYGQIIGGWHIIMGQSGRGRDAIFVFFETLCKCKHWILGFSALSCHIEHYCYRFRCLMAPTLQVKVNVMIH